jgi:hypothetical protein
LGRRLAPPKTINPTRARHPYRDPWRRGKLRIIERGPLGRLDASCGSRCLREFLVIAIYGRGDSGNLAAARIYDDVDPPPSRSS